MNEDVYLTLKRPSQGLYKEKGSKFLSFACPVEHEDQVKEILDRYKKEYHDARHHCYAFMIGTGSQAYFRANDAGEPNHSAGDPILGQIRSKGLTNVLVAVVRYFGGTKLGIPGLINAYRAAAADALDNAVIVEKVVRIAFMIHFGYEKMNEVMRLTREYDIEIAGQEFKADCLMELKVRKSQAAAVREKLARMSIRVTALTPM